MSRATLTERLLKRLARFAGLLCSSLVFWLSAASAQDFGITEVSIGRLGNVIIHYESKTDSYFILYRSEDVSNIRQAAALALGTARSGELTDATPVSATAFFRIARIPLDKPLDTDGDGID